MIAALLRRHGVRMVVALALLLPLVSMYVHGKPREGSTVVERALLRAATPAVWLGDAVIGAVVGVWRGYLDLVDVQRRNGELERDNRQLLGEALRSRALAEELRRVKALCEFRDQRGELRTLPARVIGREVSQFFRVLRIRLDVDGASEVAEGQAVITHDGVVGRVERVAGAVADVLLVTDARSQAHATIAGKGVVGTVRGKGKASEFGAEFVHLERGGDEHGVQPGDVVLTTGHDRVFPPGLELGHVTEAAPGRQGPYLEFAMTPAVMVATLEEVLIVIGTKPRDHKLPPPAASRQGRPRVDPANVPDG